MGNIPEYVYNKELLSENDIPQLPEPKKPSKTPPIDNNDNDEIDVNDALDAQQIIENVKDKIISSQNDKEYSPDPYDVDETAEIAQPVSINNLKIDKNEPIKFDGVKLGTPQPDDAIQSISGHASMNTTEFRPSVVTHDVLNKSPPQKIKTFDKDRQKLARQNSSYLDSWTQQKTTSNDQKQAVIGHVNKLSVGNLNGLDVFTPDTPGHTKTNSTIQGGFWKSQEQLSERIENSLDEAHEHRKEIMDFIKEKEETQNQSINKVNEISYNVNEIGNDLKKYELQTMERMNNMMNVLNKIQNGMNDNDKVQKIENEKNELIQKYETKIVSMEEEIKNLKRDCFEKNELINEQTIKIKEYESKQKYGMKMERIKDEILESMKSEFESLRLANKKEKSLQLMMKRLWI